MARLRWSWVLWGLLPALGWGCCRVQHGVIVRGDWSLELNRIPWMTDHGPHYAPQSQESWSTADRASPDNQAAGPAILPETPRQAEATAEGEMLPGPPGVSRFHPLPTRPVFESGASEDELLDEPLDEPRESSETLAPANETTSLQLPAPRTLPRNVTAKRAPANAANWVAQSPASGKNPLRTTRKPARGRSRPVK